MNELVNDKQTYEELKRDPTPALQRKLNSKLLKLKKTDAIDVRRYYRLRCPVPQPPKLYGLPKLHKPNMPMRLLFFWHAIYDIWLKGDSSLLDARIWKCPGSDPKQWTLTWCNLWASNKHFSTSEKYLSKRLMLCDMTRRDG